MGRPPGERAMPIFGEFETVGEPLALTDERAYVSTIWQARKTGGDARLYAIKCYAPRPRTPGSGQSEEALDKDRGLEFLEGVKQTKKAYHEGGGCLAPIHALGTTSVGVWYATDFYPRKDLKAWISLKGAVDAAGLRHIVHCIVSGCLALKRSRGYSHGNLKASNAFLAGQPRPLRSTPVVLVDAYPAAPLQLARLEEADRREASELLHQVVEAQDLRVIGELLLQLVEGRLFSRGDDYNYPVERSAAWEVLGKDGEFWRHFCNRLLDPRLSLDSVNLEKLEVETRPLPSWKEPKLIAGVAVGVLVLAGMGFLAAKWHGARVETKFRSSLQAAKDALSRTNLVAARDQVNLALKLKRGGAEAMAVSNQVFRAVETEYGLTLSRARGAVEAKDLETAFKLLDITLALKPDGAEALTLKNKVAKESEDYRVAVSAADAALRAENYSEAEKQGDIALNINPNGPEARQLTNSIRQRRDQKFTEALADAKEAISKHQYDRAIEKANLALRAKPADSRATDILKETQEKKGLQDICDTALAQAAQELDTEHYTNAVKLLSSAIEAARSLHDPTLEKQATNSAEYARLLARADDAHRRGAVSDETNALKEALKIRDRPKLRDRLTSLTTSQPPPTAPPPKVDPVAKLLDQAKQDLAKGLYQEATNSFAALLAANPEPGIAQNAREGISFALVMEQGLTLKRQHRYGDALKPFEQAKTNEWRDSRANNEYNFCQAMLNAEEQLKASEFQTAFQTASNFFSTAASLDPKDSNASAGLTLSRSVLIGDGDYRAARFPEARTNYQQASATQLYGRYATNRQEMAQQRARAEELFRKNDYTNALQSFKEADRLEASLNLRPASLPVAKRLDAAWYHIRVLPGGVAP